jgi:ketosteroid isomerase-like protein
MSEEPTTPDLVERARLNVDAYNQRDMSVLVEHTTADFELFPAVAGSVERGGIRLDSLQRYYDMLDETWEEFRIVPDEFRDLGDRVLVLGHTEGRGRGSGASVLAPWGGIFDFRDGKMWRARGFLDYGEALRAAALND